MTKNRLERHFREQLNQNNDKLWYHKIQSNTFSHTDCPADFIIITNTQGKHNVLVECKECSGPRFELKRLTQLAKLVEFEKIPHNISIVLLCFWRGSKKDSSYFLVPVSEWNSKLSSWSKQSFNQQDAMILFGTYENKYEFLVEKLVRLTLV